MQYQLVGMIAKHEGLDIDPGIKSKNGILKSMETRVVFLSDPNHTIVFHYTPRHTLWGVNLRQGVIVYSYNLIIIIIIMR
jgi:hypothetical protein